MGRRHVVDATSVELEENDLIDALHDVARPGFLGWLIPARKAIDTFRNYGASSVSVRT
jgi:hypothetical protein